MTNNNTEQKKARLVTPPKLTNYKIPSVKSSFSLNLIFFLFSSFLIEISEREQIKVQHVTAQVGNHFLHLKKKK